MQILRVLFAVLIAALIAAVAGLLIYWGPAAIMGASAFGFAAWYYGSGRGKLYYTREEAAAISEQHQRKAQEKYEAMGGDEGANWRAWQARDQQDQEDQRRRDWNEEQAIRAQEEYYRSYDYK